MPNCGAGYQTCAHCGGSGRIWDGEYIQCASCNGSGCVKREPQ